MIMIKFHVYPDYKEFRCSFDVNKTFRDLKDYLNEKYKMEKGSYYFEVDNHVMDDNIILKNNGVGNYSCINVIRNDCINIIIEENVDENNTRTVQKYLFRSDFKVITPDKKKEVKV